MPRDASSTREALIAAGLRLFAARGIDVPLRAVVESAGQKNASALHYHFGGRSGLVDAIIEVHNARIETARAAMLDELEAAGDTDLDALVVAMIEPWAALLADGDGRRYLAVVSQFERLFDWWDDPAHSPPQALRNMLLLAEAMPASVPDDVRRERITLLLMMVSEALGARARHIDRGGSPRLDHGPFVDNLTTMMVGALRALDR